MCAAWYHVPDEVRLAIFSESCVALFWHLRILHTADGNCSAQAQTFSILGPTIVDAPSHEANL